MRPLPDLSREELTRYARHVILPDVGIDGQRRLKAARVVCVGAGGLGPRHRTRPGSAAHRLPCAKSYQRGLTVTTRGRTPGRGGGIPGPRPLIAAGSPARQDLPSDPCGLADG